MKFFKWNFYMWIWYIWQNPFCQDFFFFNILIYLWSLKNVDVEKWFFKFIKKRRIENDMYINKVTEKLLKYKQK